MVRPLPVRRPGVGLKPNIPQKCAGIRILPPISEPMPSGAPRAAINAPSPPTKKKRFPMTLNLFFCC
jgi:hypothetical protein